MTSHMNPIAIAGIAAVLITAMSLFGWTAKTVSAQQTQETPTATATPQPLCGPANASGGQTIGGSTVMVTLPAPGDYSYLFVPSGPGRGELLVCHVQTDSRVAISADTCAETNRTVNSPAAPVVLDQVVASV